MTRSALVWVVSRLSIVGAATLGLLACRSSSRPENPIYTGGSDAGPTACTVATAPAPSCEVVVEAVQIDPTDGGDGGDIGDAGAPSDGGELDATLGTSACPIVTTSQIACADMSGVVTTTAAAANGEAYATLVTPVPSSSVEATQIARLKGDGSGDVDLEPVPKASTVRALTVTNADGSPGIVAETSEGDRRYFVKNGDTWSGEAIAGNPSARFALLGATSSSAGDVFALLLADNEHTTLATRTKDGAWSAGAPLSIAGASLASLATDTDGVPYVLGYSGVGTSSTFVLASGSAAPVSSNGPINLDGSPRVAVAGGRGAAKHPLAFIEDLSMYTVGIYDLANDGAQRTVGGFTGGTCPSFTIGITCDDCQVGTRCDSYLDKIYDYAVAVTDDGTVWLATIDAKIDEVAQVERDDDPILPLGCVCTTTTQSSTETAAAVVLEPLGPQGVKSGVSVRFTIPPDDGARAIALAANGSTLHVFVTNAAAVTHTAIDTSRVPH